MSPYAANIYFLIKSYSKILYRPVACAGKKHSMITATSGDCSGHDMSRGPPLKSKRITGTPFAGNKSILSVYLKFHTCE